MSEKKATDVRPPMPGRRRGGPRGAARFAPVEKPKNMNHTLRRLWRFFAAEKSTLVFVSFLILADSVVSLLMPYLIGLAINQIGVHPGSVHFSMLLMMLAVLGLFYLLDGLLTFFQGWLMATVGQRIVMSLRTAMFAKLQKLPIAFFDNRPHGDTMSRLTNDIENIDVTVSQSTVQLINDLIMIVGSFAMMIWISPILTAASLITVPLVFLLTRTIASRTAKLFLRQQQELGTLNSQIEESVSGLGVIKAFSHESEEIETFTTVNRRLTDVGTKAQIWSGYMMPLMNVINNLGFAAVATVGGLLAVWNMISVGMIASFLTYSRQFSRPLNDVASIFNTLQSAVAGAERVFEILDEKEETADRKNAKRIGHVRGEIVFDDVSFSYNPEHPVLRDIAFRVKPGEEIALVGPTGAGKTTIVNLLTRFFDPTCGRILLDGTDIRDFRRSDYRALFGMVLQDTYLFHGSVIENLRYGQPDATEAEVRRAAAAARADGFISAMKKGYRTVLDESGTGLSEGQRQLLTIARAFLADPAILVMDEATSHVDSETERNLQEGMSELRKGRTSFIIAHRLSTVHDADRILVVEDGRIAEEGTHRQLIARRGRYYRMYTDQTQLE
ncbi:MAG: ABC transporter ATP-binding protein/permease [Sporolactobacillus sp.]|jgi:ATP-binding cassette subfamily B protein|nr:ABC transporter ATP-binding protein/permease [Sporolactobacillus sp.]